jgi:hypothetical protein
MSLQAPRTLTAAAVLAATVAATGVAQNVAGGDASRSAAPSASPPTALKQLDPVDLAFWKNIRFTALSNDGKWFAYQLTPNAGDAEVVVRPTAGGEERRFGIGEPPAPAGGFGAPVNSSVVLSDDAKWLAFF